MGSFILEAFHFIGYILSYFSNGFLFFRRFLIFLVELIFFFSFYFVKEEKLRDLESWLCSAARGLEYF